MFSFPTNQKSCWLVNKVHLILADSFPPKSNRISKEASHQNWTDDHEHIQFHMIKYSVWYSTVQLDKNEIQTCLCEQNNLSETHL